MVQAICPSDPGTGPQAQKAQRLAGETAIFYNKDSEAQQGTQRSGRSCLKKVFVGVHSDSPY